MALSSQYRRNISAIDSPIESVHTNDDSSVEGDESDVEFELEQIAKKSLSWDALVGLQSNSSNSRHHHHTVSRAAKFFFLKLLMVPATAYALTFALWQYQTNFISSFVIYTMDENHKIVHNTYAKAVHGSIERPFINF